MISPELAAVIAASWLASVGAFASWRGGHRPSRLRALARDGALVVDVRSRAEFESDHADGALNIPAAELEPRQAELGEHEHPVLVYGTTWLRSALAAQKLRTIGFHTVMTAGTLVRWRRQVDGAPLRAGR